MKIINFMNIKKKELKASSILGAASFFLLTCYIQPLHTTELPMSEKSIRLNLKDSKGSVIEGELEEAVKAYERITDDADNSLKLFLVQYNILADKIADARFSSVGKLRKFLDEIIDKPHESLDYWVIFASALKGELKDINNESDYRQFKNSFLSWANPASQGLKHSVTELENFVKERKVFLQEISSSVRKLLEAKK